MVVEEEEAEAEEALLAVVVVVIVVVGGGGGWWWSGEGAKTVRRGLVAHHGRSGERDVTVDVCQGWCWC